MLNSFFIDTANNCYKKFILPLFSFVIMLSVAICVYAAENNLTPPDDCEYKLTSFADGTAIIKCTDCGDEYTIEFVDYINDYNEYLDVVEDGIVNAKDFAKLHREYA